MQLTDFQSAEIKNMIMTQKSLDISGQNLTKNSAGHISEGIKQTQILSTLIMHNLQLESNRIVESLYQNKTLKTIDLGYGIIKLGLISDETLLYLTEFLKSNHIIENISFGEDTNNPWQDQTKQLFQQNLKQNLQKIESIDVYADQKHHNFIAELGIQCQINRQSILKFFDFNQENYYDSDKHIENVNKFSSKKYFDQVFKQNLDSALYLLEKERNNLIRDEKVLNVTKEEKTEKFKENIYNSDGSAVFLARQLYQNRHTCQ